MGPRLVLPLLLAAVGMQCGPPPHSAPALRDADLYVSPCLFLHLTTCPAWLRDSCSGTIARARVPLGRTVEMRLGEYRLIASDTALRRLAASIGPQPQLAELQRGLDSLAREPSPAPATGLLRTHILNWLAPAVLEDGRCAVLSPAGDTLDSLHCRGFVDAQPGRRLAGKAYAAAGQPPFFRIVLALVPDSGAALPAAR